MRTILNTLYVISEDAYATLNGEVVEVNYPNGTKKGIPLHTLMGIVLFSYKGASPALMGKCEEIGIPITFFTPNGKYLASTGSAFIGNVLLRREQYRMADNEEKAFGFAKCFVIGKIYNEESVVKRAIRDHPLQVDIDRLKSASNNLRDTISKVETINSREILRGLEGSAAETYFSVFDELILQRKDSFYFRSRSRRPPEDNINALLSFSYALLASDCASALISVGLDPYVGFMHSDRPGRKSLALDLMEELRAPVADRFVLTLVNNRIVSEGDFLKQESGAVVLSEKARKAFLNRWQERKREEIVHPFIKEKTTWGMVPYVQALLLSRCVRGDLDGYPPFFWR